MRPWMAAIGATATMLVGAVPALGSITLGSTPTPNSGCTSGYTYIQEATAAGATSYAAPFAGVITSWSFQADAAAPTRLKLKVARDAGGGNWMIVGESTAQTPVANTVNTYSTRIPVQAGDVIGYYIEGFVQCQFHTGDANDIYGVAGGDQAPGTTASFGPNPTVQIDISAQLEPDADGDGYGDETQDQCYTDPTTQGPCPAPTISGTAALGQTLTAVPGGAPVSPSYQWLDCDLFGAGCTSIAGATSVSYIVGATDEGHTIRFRKVATDASGTQTTDSAPTADVPTPGAPPQDVAAPVISGKPTAGGILSCSQGSWTNQPTAYTYSWGRDGTPLVGATGATYVVQVLDEGTTLTCTVTASNGAGSASATSAAVLVPLPQHVLGCPPVSGRLSGPVLGQIRLGMGRAQVHRIFSHSSGRGKRYEDFFCLTPIGVRVGYPSPKLLAALPARERILMGGRVVWASTASPFYAIAGVRPGATLAAARHRLHLGKVLPIGLNDWYLGPAGPITAVLKVRHGVVQEIGIASHPLTTGRRAEQIFMTSFG